MDGSEGVEEINAPRGNLSPFSADQHVSLKKTKQNPLLQPGCQTSLSVKATPIAT